MSKKQRREVALVDRIEPCILLVRGQRVMLDADLAGLYGTTTKALNQAVKRNLDRFPADFMFQLTAEEAEAMWSQPAAANLRSQTVTSSFASHGGRRYLPYAFTEHGAIMAASVLNTPRAIDASVYVVRAFVSCGNCSPHIKNWPGGLPSWSGKWGPMTRPSSRWWRRFAV